MTHRPRISPYAVVLLGAALMSTEVLAIVGRPMTPMSVAGVARRTTRRTVYAGAAVATGAAVAGTAAMLTALPPGCANMTVAGGPYYHCGSTYYQPQYQGTEVVYVEAPPP